MQSPALIDRLAVTQYLQADPCTVVGAQFGRFAHDPRHPLRRSVNGLFDVRCSAAEAPALLAELDRLYAPTGLRYRRVAGHDEPTHAALAPILAPLGYRCEINLIMLHRHPPRRPINPDVHIEPVDPAACPWLEPMEVATGRSSHRFRHQVEQFARLGGEWLVARIDGEPAGSSGWFIHKGIARFRRVGTVPKFCGRGVATTLVRHVQEHSACARRRR